MAVRETIQVGHPALKAPNLEITDFADPKLAELIEDLKDTMRAVGLIGIAAPQIGENYRVFITEPRETDTRPADQTDELRVYINPKIVWESPELVIIWEGCGSVENAGLFGPVSRARVIEVEAQDIKGDTFKFRANGILGRVMQHEIDHTDGIEFVDRVSDKKKLKSREAYIEEEKNKPEHLAAQKITLKQYRKLT